MVVDGFGSSLSTTVVTQLELFKTRKWPPRRSEKWLNHLPKASTWNLWTSFLASKNYLPTPNSFQTSSQRLTGPTVLLNMHSRAFASPEMLDLSLTLFSLQVSTWLFQAACRQLQQSLRPFEEIAARRLRHPGMIRRQPRATLASSWWSRVH